MTFCWLPRMSRLLKRGSILQESICDPISKCFSLGLATQFRTEAKMKINLLLLKVYLFILNLSFRQAHRISSVEKEH